MQAKRTAALHHGAAIVAETLLRPQSNICFRECGPAASVEVDWPLWAELAFRP